LTIEKFEKPSTESKNVLCSFISRVVGTVKHWQQEFWNIYRLSWCRN